MVTLVCVWDVGGLKNNRKMRKQARRQEVTRRDQEHGDPAAGVTACLRPSRGLALLRWPIKHVNRPERLDEQVKLGRASRERGKRKACGDL